VKTKSRGIIGTRRFLLNILNPVLSVVDNSSFADRKTIKAIVAARPKAAATLATVVTVVTVVVVTVEIMF
jgi:hypothetical protein